MIQEIEKIITWYNQLPADFTGINELMHKRQQLTVMIYPLNSYLADTLENKNDKDSDYETRRFERRRSLINKGETASKADALSRADALPEYRELMEADALFQRMKKKSEAVAKIIDCMNQHIAVLRDERQKKID